MSGAGLPERQKRSTINDVARLSGVSIATVSKALNGRNGISESTRQHVVQAAELLSFRPSALARGLTAARTGTVGLITNDLEGRFSIPMLLGAEDAFGAEQTSVFLCDARGDVIRERHYVEQLLDRQVDGLLVVADSANPRPPLEVAVPVPVVYVYGPSTDPADLAVLTDDVAAGRLGMSHLVEIGRRRIAYLGGDLTYRATEHRVQGALEALSSAGRALIAPPIYGSWSEGWGRRGARLLLDAHPDLDAIMCGNDQIARGALDALNDAGRSVPEDVAVVGHDNWRRLAEEAREPLTTIEMNLDQVGAIAARLLFAGSDAIGASGTRIVQPTLVVRESTLGR